MELTPIQEAFDRVSKKQKVSSLRTHEIINSFLGQIERTIKQLTDEEGGMDDKAILSELQVKLDELGAFNQLGALQKEVNLALRKYGKLMDKQFCADMSKAWREMEFDSHLVNKIIALHFYKQGLFEVGDCFVNEAQELTASSLKLPFLEMYQILEHIRTKNLKPALAWAESHREELNEKGSSLEFKLHQLQFTQQSFPFQRKEDPAELPST